MIEPVGDRSLRIAFAGAGMISEFHLTGWTQTPTVEVVAVCDPIQEKAQARADEFGIRQVYTNFERVCHFPPTAWITWKP